MRWFGRARRVVVCRLLLSPLGQEQMGYVFQPPSKRLIHTANALCPRPGVALVLIHVFQFRKDPIRRTSPPAQGRSCPLRRD
jgi:hypothetical protein